MAELDPEALRDHIQVQLQRIGSESALRAEVLQAEMDRRLVNLGSLWEARILVVDRALSDLRVMLDERYATQVKATDKAFDAQQIAMKTAFEAADKAVQAALTAAKEASIKAETAAERRFEAVNEFRGQLSDQARTFLPRQEWDASRSALAERVDALSERFSALELRLSGRLEQSSGQHTGEAAQRNEARLNTGSLVAVGLLIVAVLTLIVLYASKK
jgi:hypothetical protein